MDLIFVTLLVSIAGIDVMPLHSENMLCIFVTFLVSIIGNEVIFRQYENMLLQFVTFSQSLACQQPSKVVAVEYAHFPPASRYAFMDAVVFSIVLSAEILSFPR